MNFHVGRDEPIETSSILVSDGRSAAWMAAGFTRISSDSCNVVCSEHWEFEQAALAAGHCTVPIQCFGPDRVVVTDPHPSLLRSKPVGLPEIGSGRSISAARMTYETLRAAPASSIVVTEDATFASLVDALSNGDHLLLDRVAGEARGSAIAVAVGAKAAARDRVVIAIVESTSFISGASDFEIAGRYAMPIAAIVCSEMHNSYDKLAVIAGGHGERVDDARKLELHLRNAFSAPIPTVINAVMTRAVVAQSTPIH
ncbi:MAG: thiamine pyrophosphate-dependent enzyme [Actinomycetota bacterium]